MVTIYIQPTILLFLVESFLLLFISVIRYLNFIVGFILFYFL